MSVYEIASLAISAAQALASLGAVALIWLGILQMRRAGDQRAAWEDARAAREDARHAEVMRSLDATIRGLEAVIERTGRG